MESRAYGGSISFLIGASDRKKKAIKWEWLETIIELLHGFGLVESEKHMVYYDTGDKRAFFACLALHFMMREEKILVLCYINNQ